MSGITVFTVPRSVLAIGGFGSSAYINTDNKNVLTTISIHSLATSIEDYAFSSCRNLTEINLPNGIVYIGENAFRNCSSLTDLDIPESVRIIKKQAFSGCKNIAEMILPKNVELIGTNAFDTGGRLTVRYAGTLDEFFALLEGRVCGTGTTLTVVCSDGSYTWI